MMQMRLALTIVGASGVILVTGSEAQSWGGEEKAPNFTYRNVKKDVEKTLEHYLNAEIRNFSSMFKTDHRVRLRKSKRFRQLLRHIAKLNGMSISEVRTKKLFTAPNIARMAYYLLPEREFTDYKTTNARKLPHSKRRQCLKILDNLWSGALSRCHTINIICENVNKEYSGIEDSRLALNHCIKESKTCNELLDLLNLESGNVDRRKTAWRNLHSRRMVRKKSCEYTTDDIQNSRKVYEGSIGEIAELLSGRERAKKLHSDIVITESAAEGQVSSSRRITKRKTIDDRVVEAREREKKRNEKIRKWENKQKKKTACYTGCREIWKAGYSSCAKIKKRTSVDCQRRNHARHSKCTDICNRM